MVECQSSTGDHNDFYITGCDDSSSVGQSVEAKRQMELKGLKPFKGLKLFGHCQSRIWTLSWDRKQTNKPRKPLTCKWKWQRENKNKDHLNSVRYAVLCHTKSPT